MSKPFEVTPSKGDPNLISVRLDKGCTATYELLPNGKVALTNIESSNPEAQREIDRDAGAFLGLGHLANARRNAEAHFSKERADAA